MKSELWVKNKLKLKISLTALALFMCFFGHSRPIFGTYEISGLALSEEKEPLVNFKFTCNGGTLITDERGYFQHSIKWSYGACVQKKRRKANRNMNSKKIVFESISSGAQCFVKNRWRKYGLRKFVYFQEPEESRIYNVKLIFITDSMSSS